MTLKTLLVNNAERLADAILDRWCADRDLHLERKVRLESALDVDRSVKELFRRWTGHEEAAEFQRLDGYLLTAEYDFVVYESRNGSPLLAVEIDGASHRSDHAAIRDQKKNFLSYTNGLPLLRVSSEVVGIEHPDFLPLRWLVDRWFTAKPEDWPGHSDRRVFDGVNYDRVPLWTEAIDSDRVSAVQAECMDWLEESESDPDDLTRTLVANRFAEAWLERRTAGFPDLFSAEDGIAFDKSYRIRAKAAIDLIQPRRETLRSHVGIGYVAPDDDSRRYRPNALLLSQMQLLGWIHYREASADIAS